MSKGIIYVMSTVVPGLIKIGQTMTTNFENRMRNLEHNGYSNVTGLKRVFAIEVDDYIEKESLLHTIFEKSRVGDTELFSLDLNIAKQLLSSFEGTVIYPKDPPHNCAQPRHIIPADPNFEKKRNSSALFAREINLVTQPSFDCEQGINSQVQTACSNADAIFPVLGIVFCKNERFSLSRKTHVPLWNEPRISHVRLP